MKSFICCVTVVLAVGALSSSAEATPTTYEYFQTGASLPGYQVAASVTIDGTFSDLPTLACNGQLPPSILCPTGFGTLQDFSFDAPYGPWTLQNFILTGVNLTTMWSISPSGIFFHNQSNQFLIDFGAGTTSFLSDGFNCYPAATCATTGYWAPVPEPFSGSLLGIGLVGVAIERLRARRARHQAA